MITAIISASGFAKRMGEEKLLLHVGGKPIVQYALDLVSNCDFYERLITIRLDSYHLLQIAKNYPSVRILMNELACKGQSESVKLGVKSTDANHYMFFVADQPFLSASIVQKLIDTAKLNPTKIVVPTSSGINRSPTIFPSLFREELLCIDGDMGGRQIIKDNLDDVLFIPFENDIPFTDVDTKEDYETTLRRLL